MEPDQDRGWCEMCEKGTLVSGLVLGGIIEKPGRRSETSGRDAGVARSPALLGSMPGGDFRGIETYAGMTGMM